MRDVRNRFFSPPSTVPSVLAVTQLHPSASVSCGHDRLGLSHSILTQNRQPRACAHKQSIRVWLKEDGGAAAGRHSMSQSGQLDVLAVLSLDGTPSVLSARQDQ